MNVKRDKVWEAIGPKVKKNGESLKSNVEKTNANVEEVTKELACVALVETEALAVVKNPANHGVEALAKAFATVTASADKQDQLNSDLKLLQEKLSFAQNAYARWHQSLAGILDLRYKIKQEQAYYKAYESWCEEILLGNKSAIKPAKGPLTLALANQAWDTSHGFNEGDTA